MSSLTGEIREQDGGGFAGWIATPTVDLEIEVVSNKEAAKSRGQPDYDIFTTSPAGRRVLMGAVWKRVDVSRRDYLSMRIDITGREEKVGAFPRFNKLDPKADRVYELIPVRE